VIDPNLKITQPLPHVSFPSGHSFGSYVNVELLSRLARDRREDLMKAAQEFACSRALLVETLPVPDSKAGRIGASGFVKSLFEKKTICKGL
jgi:hypothetical protein